ncbi:MAG: hypothetical protein CVT92_02940 [Bacteroidetes bacterium HGW-Bacteroidetes-1]|jgi:hypothetical protein|nr:MAG: hypothetical protein CVT92_02940 [Bacteroidetes bacterium HGW-Bacteroidetes-1]
MKYNYLIITLLLLTHVAWGQERSQNEYQTVFGNKKNISHGGYGALTIGTSSIGGSQAVFTGIKGGWLIDHRLTIGIAGTGFVNNIHIDLEPGSVNSGLSGGYGGLLIEPILAPFSPVHLSFPVIIGAGGIAYIDRYYWENGNYDPWVMDADAFFVVEPGVEVELNIVRFLRLAVGVSYRYTSEILMDNAAKDVLHGLSGGLSLKFGKF